MPVAMALRGMPSYSAVSGDCAITRPPSPLTSRRPSVPSLPVPESTTQMARSRWVAASELKKWSTVRCGLACALVWGVRCRVRPTSLMSWPGGMT
jgi:hypothetical protein